MTLKQLVLLAVVAGILGLGVNLISPNKIAYIGDYRELSDGDGPIVPPTAAEGDPPFIALNEAYLEYTSGKTIFIDARDEEEYVCGTIPGSVHMPFEYLPEGNLAGYFDTKLSGAAKDTKLITFCSGEECDLSLHLGRNLQDFGYTNVYVFFGGAREWEKAGLKIERRQECGE